MAELILNNPTPFKLPEQRNIMERVQTFHDADIIYNEGFNRNNVDLLAYFNISGFLLYEGNNKLMLSTQAYLKLSIIAGVLNEGWTPNWEDTNERKWFPYFVLSSFGFAGSHCRCVTTDADVGSRLCFKSEELSDYMGTQFLDLYKQYMQ